MSVVSILSHQTPLTEMLVAELECREIDWMQAKHNHSKGKAALCRVTSIKLALSFWFHVFRIKILNIYKTVVFTVIRIHRRVLWASYHVCCDLFNADVSSFDYIASNDDYG
jgi:hypothetical protein